jgi:hypothetical protein
MLIRVNTERDPKTGNQAYEYLHVAHIVRARPTSVGFCEIKTSDGEVINSVDSASYVAGQVDGALARCAALGAKAGLEAAQEAVGELPTVLGAEDPEDFDESSFPMG